MTTSGSTRSFGSMRSHEFRGGLCLSRGLIFKNRIVSRPFFMRPVPLMSQDPAQDIRRLNDFYENSLQRREILRVLIDPISISDRHCLRSQLSSLLASTEVDCDDATSPGTCLTPIPPCSSPRRPGSPHRVALAALRPSPYNSRCMYSLSSTWSHSSHAVSNEVLIFPLSAQLSRFERHRSVPNQQQRSALVYPDSNQLRLSSTTYRLDRTSPIIPTREDALVVFSATKRPPISRSHRYYYEKPSIG